MKKKKKGTKSQQQYLCLKALFHRLVATDLDSTRLTFGTGCLVTVEDIDSKLFLILGMWLFLVNYSKVTLALKNTTFKNCTFFVPGCLARWWLAISLTSHYCSVYTWMFGVTSARMGPRQRWYQKQYQVPGTIPNIWLVETQIRRVLWFSPTVKPHLYY